MHELSICRSLVGIVTEHAAGRAVERIHLDVGHLRQVVPETLRSSWQIVVTDTDLEGSELEINHVPVVLDCRTCGSTTTVDTPLFRCGCGSTDVEMTSGQELLVTALELTGAQ